MMGYGLWRRDKVSAPKGNQGIYKITSPSGRVYIGQSSDIATRFSRYRGLHCAGQRRLYASFKKHGISAHKFEVIETLGDYQEMLPRERYWQEFYDSIGERGLNCKLVTKDCHSGKHSEITKKRMSDSAKGRKHTDESKEKMRAARVGRKMPEETRLAMIGRKQSVEQVEKHKTRMMGNSYTKGVVPVNARKIINKDTGEVFASISIAAKAMGYKPRTLKAWIDGQLKNKSPLEVYNGK